MKDVGKGHLHFSFPGTSMIPIQEHPGRFEMTIIPIYSGRARLSDKDIKLKFHADLGPKLLIDEGT